MKGWGDEWEEIAKVLRHSTAFISNNDPKEMTGEQKGESLKTLFTILIS